MTVDRHPGESRDLGSERLDGSPRDTRFRRDDEPAVNLPYLFAKRNGIALVGKRTGGPGWRFARGLTRRR